MDTDTLIQPLTQDIAPSNLPSILVALSPLSAHNVVNFGLLLNVKKEVIERFEVQYNHNMRDILREIVNQRLKQEPGLTWRDIVSALRSPLLQEEELARKIESQYIPVSEQKIPATITTNQVLLAPPQTSGMSSQTNPYPSGVYPTHHPISFNAIPYHPNQSDSYPLASSYGPTQYCLSQNHPNILHSPSHHHLFYPPIQSQVGASLDPTHNPHSKAIPQLVPNSQDSVENSPLLSRYIDYVRTVYRSSEVERSTQVVKWPPTPSQIYINLVCIDRMISSRQRKEYDEVTKAMVQSGNIDVVHGKKWPIDFNQIASGVPDIGQKRVILVEGAPGVGKSTFAWEYCRRWERGEIAQQYQLVLLLRLRDERMSNAKTLRDLVTYDSEAVCQAVVTYLQCSHGSKTLILLEGFDELPDTCRTPQSVFLQLICGELLPLATVMVTSRPWATRVFLVKFKHRIFQHIEILGFTARQVSQYIESVLPETEAKDLESYVKAHPQIRGCMYIPLNSAIVVTVYQENQASGFPLPKTITELYTTVAQTLLVRYIHGHPELENSATTQSTIGIFSGLTFPSEVKRNFIELCHLAYNGIVGKSDQVQLIFRESDLPVDFDNLGFMDSVTELYVTRGTVSSHNFLHLTFQEFFAAVHISTMSSAEQLQHFHKHDHGRLKVVLRFLAGITKLQCFSIENAMLMFIFPPPQESKRYSLSCDAEVDINLLNWIFEVQDEDVIALLLEQRTVKFEAEGSLPLPMDYYSLGYCIAHSQCQWVLHLDYTREDQTEMLVAGANLTPKPGGRIVGINAYNDSGAISRIFVGLKSILHLQELFIPLRTSCNEIPWPNLTSLRILVLEITRRTNNALETLLQQLSLESLTVMCHPGDHVRLSSKDCLAVAAHIRDTTTLKQFSLVCLTIKNGEQMENICRVLASNKSKSLEKLEIDCPCLFTDIAAAYMSQLLTNSTTLKCLQMSQCTFSVYGLRLLAEALQNNSTLQEKNLCMMLVHESNKDEVDKLLRRYPDMKKSITLIH